jgi:hypothetical protein
MTVPWKLWRWTTSLPIDDCIERLLAAPAAAAGSPRASSVSLVVTMIGRTLTMSVASRMRWLPSRPYLHAVMVERQDGTVIVGRFNPDPLVVAAGMCAIVGLVLPVAAVFMVGVSGLLRVSSYWFVTTNGLTSSALALTVLGVGVIRSRGWDRQCRMISSVLKKTCGAAPIGPSRD